MRVGSGRGPTQMLGEIVHVMKVIHAWSEFWSEMSGRGAVAYVVLKPEADVRAPTVRHISLNSTPHTHHEELA